MLRTLAILLLSMTLARADTSLLNLALPTDNTALLRGDNSEFYQVVERNLYGVISYPWQGGQYGFVRDPVVLGGEIIYSRFHEGIDIRPMRRDTRGEPLDEVRAIADGTVEYVNVAAGASNYGRYVVVEHEWAGCPYYSLYAHLHLITVQAGQHVRQGDKLAIMGHTGEGINRERAHLHLELNLLLNDHFPAWHDTYFKNEPNPHGIYNGLNLAGMDIARLYLESRRDSLLTIPAFLRREAVFYKITIPHSDNFQLPRRYPWMLRAADERPVSWEVSFARSGLPLAIAPSDRAVVAAELSHVKQSRIDYRYLTRGVITGRGEKGKLTDSGKALMRLLIFPD